MEANADRERRSARPRLYRLYFVLAAFDLATVIASLFLINHLSSAFDASVIENQVWARRLGELSNLSGLASGVNAPGNDVFESRDLAQERGRLDEALERFRQKLAAVRADFGAIQPPERAADLLDRLERVEHANAGVVDEARQIFELLRDDDAEEAARRMAVMDQHYASAGAAIAGIARSVRAIQGDVLEQQRATAARLRVFEYVIAALIVLMVAGVLFYGHSLANRMTATERELALHREHLEDLVEQRTRELERSSEQLRQAERLASIGTLAAGLGHDMSNVLLPVRCQLDVLDAAGLDTAAATELSKIRKSVAYLQNLSDGLRLLARSPNDPAADGVTDVPVWWGEIETLLRAAVPKRVRIDEHLEEPLAPVAVAPHHLTQAVLNLAVNAGEAIDGAGTIRMAFSENPAGDRVLVRVEDDGAGMTPEVRRRATDPFYTTKSRTLSTGLGLALVHGIVQSAGGTFDIDSEPGVGTIVTLELPVAHDGAVTHRAEETDDLVRAAWVSIADGRLASYVQSVLRAEGADVRAGGPPANGAAGLWIVEPSEFELDRAAAMASAGTHVRLVVLGEADPRWDELGAIFLPARPKLDELRAIARWLHDGDPKE